LEINLSNPWIPKRIVAALLADGLNEGDFGYVPLDYGVEIVSVEL
jgi:hypothetical protein